MAQNLDLRCVLVPAPGGSQHLGCWGQNTSRIQEYSKKFTPHYVWRGGRGCAKKGKGKKKKKGSAPEAVGPHAVEELDESKRQVEAQEHENAARFHIAEDRSVARHVAKSHYTFIFVWFYYIYYGQGNERARTGPGAGT